MAIGDGPRSAKPQSSNKDNILVVPSTSFTKLLYQAMGGLRTSTDLTCISTGLDNAGYEFATATTRLPRSLIKTNFINC
ncbi:hypothetical protein TNCV_1489591 [Trichonephila clavipes]|nr:hypothetical protein TNCV_1489591 [Trichonephila clavipes]